MLQWTPIDWLTLFYGLGLGLMVYQGLDLIRLHLWDKIEPRNPDKKKSNGNTDT